MQTDHLYHIVFGLQSLLDDGLEMQFAITQITLPLPGLPSAKSVSLTLGFNEWFYKSILELRTFLEDKGELRRL